MYQVTITMDEPNVVLFNTLRSLNISTLEERKYKIEGPLSFLNTTQIIITCKAKTEANNIKQMAKDALKPNSYLLRIKEYMSDEELFSMVILHCKRIPESASTLREAMQMLTNIINMVKLYKK